MLSCGLMLQMAPKYLVLYFLIALILLLSAALFLMYLCKVSIGNYGDNSNNNIIFLEVQQPLQDNGDIDETFQNNHDGEPNLRVRT